MSLRLTEEEKVFLSNKILDKDNITFYEYLYAIDHINVEDIRYKKFSEHAEYFVKYIFERKPLPDCEFGSYYYLL